MPDPIIINLTVRGSADPADTLVVAGPLRLLSTLFASVNLGALPRPAPPDTVPTDVEVTHVVR